jgi:DNA repair exonuclease SbcCD ATPase subunit
MIAKLKDQIQSLEDSQTNSHLRKVQNELDTALIALEDFKRQSQQTTEQLEKRYREEIRQLQNGSDDTAQAWLEKTRSAQQQVDQLHDQIHSKEQSHADLVHALKETHAQEIDKLTEALENKEAQIEEQSSQIEDLLFQVETLQNSLEAATVRLEHTAKSTPTSSSNRDDINNSTSHDPIKNIHQECLDRIDAKQKELDDVKARLLEIKEAHEVQLNRLGQEKANALQELRKTITSLEQKLAATTPPHSPTRPNSVLVNGQGSDEERLIRIAEQHRKEISTMHEQYQRVVDTKDRELEDYAYRIKALVAAKQKDIEKLQIETNNTIDRYERDIEGYEVGYITTTTFIGVFLGVCVYKWVHPFKFLRGLHSSS